MIGHHIDQNDLSHLFAAVRAGRLDRRELLRRSAALGSILSLSGLSANQALAQEGGELTVAASADIDTLDPHVSQLLLYNNMMRLTCFNSLVRYSPTLEYLPDLAESWENPDERTYVFTLREGVTYHNGQELEAGHVEFSLNRIAEKQTVFSSRVANVERYEVVDGRTISITLNTVQADFIDGLILLSIISPEIAKEVEQNPIGTGPFRFVEWATNDHITLERNPDYFEDGIPGVDRLTFRVIPEPQVAITNLQADSVQGVLELPVSQAAPFEDAEDVTAHVVPTSSMHMFELMGKNSEPIRSSTAVRQALAHCLDKDAVQQTVFSGEGRQKWTFAPTDTWAYKEVSGYPHDPEMAGSLLAEAGYVDGFEFTVIVPSGSPDGEQAATIWQAGLDAAGVSLNIEVQELSVWLDNYINHTYDVTWNVFPGFADPNYFVSFALDPHFADQWQNEEAQHLATDANATLDQDQRAELYGRLQEIFVAELPILVIQEAPQASLTNPDLTGWEINPLGYVILRNVTFEG